MPRISRAEARSQIVDIIGENVLQALALKESLENERKALETQDIDALDAVVNSKSTCAENLQLLDRKRGALCQACGFSDGPDQMQQLIDWCDEDGLISSRWEQLLDVAAEGNALNLTNGAIIRVRQQQFESSLSVLRGVMPGSDTYSRNGEESGDFSRRSLAEA
ncbi:MAG: flagellar protein FlgN [Gammaproteobacteria bacterium]|nr:flagellar protein FlgN [Gammaproteobacteria bacterium]